MCLYFTQIENPRYKKIGTDKPWLKYVTIKCGQCVECRQARAREWVQRLDAELRFGDTRPRYFVTLTIAEETALRFGIDYQNMDAETRLSEKTYEKEHEMVKKLIQRWRHACEKAKVKKKQWLITEHGEDNSYRIHLHGIIWTDNIEKVKKNWTAGFLDVGEIRPETIHYLVKYVHKVPDFHKNYKSIILTSPGIGDAYTLLTSTKKRHEWKGKDTNYSYRMSDGKKLQLCDYYKKKLFKTGQLEERRRIINDAGQRWVKGIEYNSWDMKSMREMNNKLYYEQQRTNRLNLPKPKEKIFLLQNSYAIDYEKERRYLDPDQKE